MKHLQVLFEPSWATLELELASVMHGTIKSYGALYNGQSPVNLYKPISLVMTLTSMLSSCPSLIEMCPVQYMPK